MDQFISLSTKAKRRTRTSPEEKRILESHFLQNPNPNQRQKENIAKMLQMEVKNVHFWFQNRRAQNSKHRRLNGDGDYSSSNSSGTSSRRYDHQEEVDGGNVHWISEGEHTRNKITPISIVNEGHNRFDLQRLPPISSLMNQSIEEQRYNCSPAPMIPFFFHHSDFGIESCMIQWRKRQKNY